MSPASQQPKLVSSKLWQTRRAHYLAVFERALLLLRESPALPEEEPGLTRALLLKTTTASRELDPEGRYGHPERESENLPDPSSDVAQAHEYKIPDFQWKYADYSEPDDQAIKVFVVECKRLGATTQTGLRLNDQYVFAGISRFRDPAWKYGFGMPEGGMIGFVQTMDFDSIAKSINAKCAGVSLAPVDLANVRWESMGVSRLISLVERGFPASPFCIYHLWLDLRDKPLMPTRARNTSKTLSPRKRPGSRRKPSK